jgi:uncharacterized protein (DUF433 family)
MYTIPKVISNCPDCGNRLIIPDSSYILRNNIREEISPREFCSNYKCGYGRETQFKDIKKFNDYAQIISFIIPDTEIDLDRCGGFAVFTKSRLPVTVILSLISYGETDDDIMAGYPRMNKFLLGICRKVMADLPPP